jgi:hypothetical protein
MDGLVKRGVTLAVMRVWLICWIALILHQPFHILAGHDLMVHLAIYNDGPFETEQVPAVFGVPLPSSDDPVAPKDLILVGADTWQIKPLSHWPNGSIRWMLVEAIVNVQPNQDRAAFQLTTGQAPEEQPLIGSKIPNEFVLDTGKCRIRISGREGDDVVCHITPPKDATKSLRVIHLTQDENELGELHKRTLFLENNGPVTATITLVETYDYAGSKLTYTRRCRAYKNQDGFTIESTLLRLPWGQKTIPLPFPSLKTTTSEEGLLQIRTHGEPQPSAKKASQMAPGSMRRMWHTINLPSAEETTSPTLRPYLGRAISTNTYNDAHCTEAYVTAGTANASLNLQEIAFSRSMAAQFIRDIMGGKKLPTPSKYQALTEWMQSWTPEIETGQLNGTPAAEDSMDSMKYDDAWRIPSLWYFMTGESIFKDLRMNDARNQTDVQFDLRQYHRLWDAYLLTDSLELRDSIADKVSNWFNNVSDWEAIRKNRHLFRMVSNLIHQGGFGQQEHDVWLDQIESLVHHDRNPHLELNDILFAEGYRLTGDKKFLKEGQQWLEQSYGESTMSDTITGLVLDIQRQHVWRWIELTMKDHGEDGWELSWKAPKNAVRYRFKQSDRVITNPPDTNSSPQAIPFHAAENLALDISPAAPGILQTVLVKKDITADNKHFAMRYLERGPDLPALKTSPTNEGHHPVSSTPVPLTPKTYADFMMIGLLVLGLGIAFIVWKKFI